MLPLWPLWLHSIELVQRPCLAAMVRDHCDLQAAGVDELVAGNYVQLFVFLGIGVGYISTYISRVANKVPGT